MKRIEYTQRAAVILPLMYLGSFLVSAIAANGMPQLATGPQKWVLLRRVDLVGGGLTSTS